MRSSYEMEVTGLGLFKERITEGSVKVPGMRMNLSSSEDENASALDVIGSGHGAEQEEMTLQWQRALGYSTFVSNAEIPDVAQPQEGVCIMGEWTKKSLSNADKLQSAAIAHGIGSATHQLPVKGVFLASHNSVYHLYDSHASGDTVVFQQRLCGLFKLQQDCMLVAALITASLMMRSINM
ncbi:hypothetical protein EK904_008551 [Melospiza melodia maxima]|nr:hypothetical protein EK904_008551 [Melospiza melodia maxima]